MNIDLEGKRLELLSEMVPASAPVAVLINPHEVSILMSVVVGRCHGVEPRPKVSMMTIWPPQHGQGDEITGWRSVASPSAC